MIDAVIICAFVTVVAVGWVCAHPTIWIVKVNQGTSVEPGKELFEGSLIDYRHTAHGKSARILRGLLKRRVKLHYIYTGGRINTFNHKSQFFSMFKGIEFDKQLKLDYIPHMQHTQEFEEDRKELVTLIGQRISTTQYSQQSVAPG